MTLMSSATKPDVSDDLSLRFKIIRGARGLTQTQFAALVGVSFASVNRWENGQSRPNNLAWRRIVDLERPPAEDGGPVTSPERPSAMSGLDFSADPSAVAAVAEAHHLAHGHLFNRAFATETSRIDPLPHQRIAVYGHMLDQSPLRFLLADDAGADKTIMAGLYVREMLARRLIRRVLVVSPAGLVGNWEREMRTLFRLQFRIMSGADARTGNPFSGPESDLAIVSIDTLAAERMFGRLREVATGPYDLVVFDEAHKLSANREPDFRVRKTDRYRLAEALAGVGADSDRWTLHWSARHLLLLTATPHMGKDYPHYYLWRLLAPDTLSTYDAFAEFPHEARKKHFIRRTKEEMVRFDGTPLYPQRTCDTLSYDLSQGPAGEQALYDETTDYIRDHYNRARVLNRSAARLAMSVFQRRLASSTYAPLRSFERRKERLEGLIDDIRSGRLTEEQLARRQRRLDELDDPFEKRTADEDAPSDGDGEEHERFERRALEGTIAVNLAELESERLRIEGLLVKTRKLFHAGEESKFEKLREVLRNPEHVDQKLIAFTEHRDTAQFLVRRLEGLGFTGQVAQIHGGMPYREREQQVEFFRRPADGGGANYLVATDAAGEGINLQFCWLMVNYDIPWNPARLEQRMGRIHRYGQVHDPVVIVNLIAGKTREGRVLKTLLDKLEAMRRQLDSDKVFDVVGRLFEGISFKDYLELAVSEDDAEAVVRRLEGRLTEDQIRALEEKERSLFGGGGDVRRGLAHLNEEMERESYLRVLPGYVRRFVEKAAPLLHLEIDGALNGTFGLRPGRARSLDPLLPALELHPEETRGRPTAFKPQDCEDAIWLHPGEPIFDRFSAAVLARCASDALKGTVFADPNADEPYLFHTALMSIERTGGATRAASDDAGGGRDAVVASGGTAPVEARFVGLRQTGDGAVEEWPVEHLLLLRGLPHHPPGRVPLAALARRMASEADAFVRNEIGGRIAQSHRQRLLDELPARLELVTRGYDYRAAELAAARAGFAGKARAGDSHAKAELARIKERQRGVVAVRDRRLADLRAEPDRIRVGEVEFLAHALVVPSPDSEETRWFDAEVEAVVMRIAAAYEESFHAEVKDVSRPKLARRAGLTDRPGFDLLSVRPDGRRAIEVKGRADLGEVEVSENEWAKACNLRDGYWLYVVFDCATPRPGSATRLAGSWPRRRGASSSPAPRSCPQLRMRRIFRIMADRDTLVRGDRGSRCGTGGERCHDAG